jgi:hypothetical protein
VILHRKCEQVLEVYGQLHMNTYCSRNCTHGGSCLPNVRDMCTPLHSRIKKVHYGMAPERIHNPPPPKKKHKTAFSWQDHAKCLLGLRRSHSCQLPATPCISKCSTLQQLASQRSARTSYQFARQDLADRQMEPPRCTATHILIR